MTAKLHLDAFDFVFLPVKWQINFPAIDQVFLEVAIHQVKEHFCCVALTKALLVVSDLTLYGVEERLIIIFQGQGQRDGLPVCLAFEFEAALARKNSVFAQ